MTSIESYLYIKEFIITPACQLIGIHFTVYLIRGVYDSIGSVCILYEVTPILLTINCSLRSGEEEMIF